MNEDALLERLLPEAVHEMWDEPARQGLKFCCEDVVNYLAYEGANIILGKDKGSVVDDLELLDRLMGKAIELVRDKADEYGIEFVDVWN